MQGAFARRDLNPFIVEMREFGIRSTFEKEAIIHGGYM
jgi:hypothetical protein